MSDKSGLKKRMKKQQINNPKIDLQVVIRDVREDEYNTKHEAIRQEGLGSLEIAILMGESRLSCRRAPCTTA
jgi:hypothetical protein